MTEPEEESDEEWLRIAEAVGVIEQQFNQARAQTAQTAQVGSGRVETVQDHEKEALPPPPQIQAGTGQELQCQIQRLEIQPSRPPQEEIGRGNELEQQHNLQRPELQSGDTFREKPLSRKRRAPGVSTPQHSPPAAHLPSSPPPQRPPPPPDLQSPCPPVQPLQEDKMRELNDTITALQEENRRMKTEYTTRIRHLEARVSQTNEANSLRRRLNLAERELRELHRSGGGAAVQTQACEVVEATQTGLDVLKASIKPPAKESVIFGAWGMDDGFRDEVLREALFEIGVESFGSVVRPAVRGEWATVTRALVALLDGEAWVIGLRGLCVALRSKEGRREVVDVGTVRKLLRLRCEEVFPALEGVIMGAAEAGCSGDDVRSAIIGDEYLEKCFKKGCTGAAALVKTAVVTALECEDGRLSDEEWSSVEGLIREAARMVSMVSVGNDCLELLSVCAVLAGDVVVRVGGIEALLNVVVDGVLTEEMRRTRVALQAVFEVSKDHELRVKEGVKMVVLPFLMDLVRKDGATGAACYVTAALYNSCQ